MDLSVKNVQNTIKACLPEKVTEEQKKLVQKNGHLDGHIVVRGVIHGFLFREDKIKEQRENILSMLGQLPKQFMGDGGGGWTFLNGCMNDKGEQWGEQSNVDELICLGLAIESVQFCLPRYLWASLPGSVPYFTVNLNGNPRV